MIDNTRKNPDRLNINKAARLISNEIDNKDYFGLGLSYGRIGLFIFAMALGSSSIPIHSHEEDIINGTDGFVRDASIDYKSLAIIYSYYIKEKLISNDIDKVALKEDVYKSAEACANSGFIILKNYFDTLDEADLRWELLKQMNEMYENYQKEGLI